MAISDMLDELYKIRSQIEDVQTEIESVTPHLQSILLNLQGQEKDLEEGIKEKCKFTSGKGHHTQRGVFLQAVLSSSTKWDVKKLEAYLGDKIGEFRKVSQYWSIRKTSSK